MTISACVSPGNIPVNEAETDPLVGMGLLYGYDLYIRAVEDGNVTIKPIE